MRVIVPSLTGAHVGWPAFGRLIRKHRTTEYWNGYMFVTTGPRAEIKLDRSCGGWTVFAKRGEWKAVHA